MLALNLLFVIYVSGLIGSTLGIAIARFPTTFEEIDDALLIIFFWPWHAYQHYNGAFDRRVQMIARDRIIFLGMKLEHANKTIHHLTIIIQQQDEKYRDLASAYAKLKQREAQQAATDNSQLLLTQNEEENGHS